MNVSRYEYQKSKEKKKLPPKKHRFLIVVLIVGALILFWPSKGRVDIPKTTPTPTPSLAVTPSQPQFDNKQFSLETPGSIWWVVNKKRPLTEGYRPKDLVVPNVALRLAKEAEQMTIDSSVAPAIKSLFDAGKLAGYSFVFGSGFRSANYQKQLYNTYVESDGVAGADTYSARPGYSEHQTGLTFDIQNSDGVCTLEICFGDTASGRWIADHAHEYGFIVRYLKGKTAFTGYQYEPWHLRYVGQDLAKKLYSSGQTIEEFFGLDPAPNY